LSKGKALAWTLKHAQVLLKVDRGPRGQAGPPRKLWKPLTLYAARLLSTRCASRGSFPPRLLAMKRVAWHIRTGTMMGRKSRFLLSRGCHWKQDRLASYLQEISLPAPHSLPFSSIRGTDVPGSQYKYILTFNYST